ncbi:metalloregulator ArsR/SmtB family transcription factor [Kutzneria sp. NPDC051319]|uniref:ArsR/SmtB family transcription factor n=1 Tax=Kutzneria sp. NPDC051319 TaxID=3155047 RepID=UPI00342FD44F
MASRARTEVAPVAAHDPVSTGSDERAAQLFKALADPVRVRLVRLVRTAENGEECFCGLASEFDMPQGSLSHHLNVLVKAGVLARERRGTWSWYRVCPDAWHALSTFLAPGGFLASRPATDPSRCH